MALLIEEQIVIALSKQNERTHWDIWKGVILLFKKLNLKATYRKARALRQEIVPKAESISEMKDFKKELELESDRSIIQEVENEVVVRTSRVDRVLKLSIHSWVMYSFSVYHTLSSVVSSRIQCLHNKVSLLLSSKTHNWLIQSFH